MIRRTHYRCVCGHYEGEHYECTSAHTNDVCAFGEAPHMHCSKCVECTYFRLDKQHEHDLYEQAQERKYDEWKDRQDEDDE
jgi:hypothetical protein